MTGRRVLPSTGLAMGLATAVLAACASGPGADVARRAQTELIGMPKDVLLSCAGVPERQAVASGREYYTYVARPTAAISPLSSVGIGGGSGGVGLGVGLGVPIGTSGSDGCETTVVLGPTGRVEQVSYPAGASLSACAPLVQNCVAR